MGFEMGSGIVIVICCKVFDICYRRGIGTKCLCY